MTLPILFITAIMTSKTRIAIYLSQQKPDDNLTFTELLFYYLTLAELSSNINMLSTLPEFSHLPI